jgi:hypothetical protein
MGKDFGDQHGSKHQPVTGNDFDTRNIDFKIDLPASIFASDHPLSLVGILLISVTLNTLTLAVRDCLRCLMT